MKVPVGAGHLLSVERVRSVRRLNAVRLCGAGFFLALFAVLGTLLGLREWQGNLSLLLVYAAASAVLYARSDSEQGARRAAWAVVLLDMPAVFLAQWLTYDTTPNPGAVAGYTLGLYVFLVVMSAFTLEFRWIVPSALVASALEMWLQHLAGISVGAQLSTVAILGLTAALMLYLGQRTRVLLEFSAKQAEKRVETKLALAATEESFRALVQHSPEPLLIHHAGRILFVNAAMAELLGHSSQSLRDVPLTDLLEPLDHERLRSFAQDPFHVGSGGRQLEVHLLLGNGSSLPVELSQQPVIFEGLSGALCSVRNLAPAREAQARAIAADRLASLGTIAAGVVHELNNPLAYVASTLSFVEEAVGELPPQATGESRALLQELKDAARQGKEGVKQMRALVADVKTFSHAGAPEPELFDVRKVLASAINMASGHLKDKAQLVRELGEVPEVSGHPNRLGQVVLNLLVNAAQALPPHRASSHTVTVHSRVENDSKVVLEVRDTGPGIPPAVRAHLFEPFFTTKPRGEGTGLGLSISRSIITEMGGTIDCESEVGRGTTFRIVLPAARE